MAKKNNAKPMPLAAAILIAVATVVVIGIFLIYLLAPNTVSEESSVGENSYEQSYGEESSLEPPPEQVVVKETMADAQVGDAVVFGAYEQNGNSSDGAEKLEWIVLEKQDDKLLLISRYCLDAKPVNESAEDIEWASTSLCKWLNDGFLNSVFSEEEIASIIGNEGIKVTIPSVEEVKKYYEYDSWRAGDATAYAVANGVRVQNGKCWWWLIDNGEISCSNSYVYFNGTVRTDGFAVNYAELAVRPMMWVSADAETETEHISQPETSEDAEASDAASEGTGE